MRNCIVALLIITGYAAVGHAASILKISKKKGVVQIDTSGDSNFKKDASVCFFNKKEEKIGCGKIKSIKGTKAIVKLGKKNFKGLKKDFVVKLEDGKASASSQPFMIIRGFWAGAIMPQVTYNKLTYLPPEADQTETLWESTGKADAMLLSFGAEIEMPSFNLAVGFRYRSYQPVEFTTDYVKPADNFYVTGTLSGSSIGFYIDYYYLSFSGVQLGAGLDVDMNSLEMSATVKDDNGTQEDQTLATASSSLTAISLRAPIRYNLDFGPVGVTAGINIVLPLAGSPSTTAEVTDNTNGEKLSVDPIEDLTAQIGHQTNSFALELIIGLHFPI